VSDLNIPSPQLTHFQYVIARHRGIRTLSMLNMPVIDYGMTVNPHIINLESISGAHSKLCRVVMQKFANEIMRFTDVLGSNVKLFAAQPGEVAEASQRPGPDINGHRWPEYFYLKGRNMNLRGVEDAVALPLRGTHEEMNGERVLFL
jgi:hypothetical protein